MIVKHKTHHVPHSVSDISNTRRYTLTPREHLLKPPKALKNSH